ncbi:hypothetical protein [Vagococcus bubulae]|uniref:Lipoprotein n=1 Tax=Vagococcus bubulae TaxID=1977868 RepID=A0A429ZCW8_9ENTE|nr:hypothetical protein [Vagococcus bubulae]RST91548.1 hypothetical protein CBF36_09955 [Vagococcus bubulae]
MKKKIRLLLIVGGLLCLAGCSNKTIDTTTSFDKSNQTLVKDKAQEFTNEQYQNGDVRLKTYVKMTGKIIKTDSQNENEIKKNDRFVIQNEGYDYQVINSSDTILKLDDVVDVYGEYYGFVQGVEIEIN